MKALICATVILINNTKLPWNAHDFEMRDRAKTRCSELYPESPCLKKFYKRNFQDYFALCGKP